MIGAIGLIEARLPRFDGDFAHAVNRIACVDAKIREDLIDLGRVHHDLPKVRLGQPGKIYVLADQATEHLEHSLYDLVYIQYLGADGLLAGKGQ